MQNYWNQQEAEACGSALALRVYTSRLLGRDRSLVLHGGGNTSVKTIEKNIVGDEEQILYIKGSGWDLASIEASGFSPARMAPVLSLLKLSQLSDKQMMNELRTSLKNASSPDPSVEAILHAMIPFTFVDHTHADAVVTITNTPCGKAIIEEIYGDEIIIVPYIMPGFDLAKLCHTVYTEQAKASTIGMVLLNHGIFSFGETARESYDRMIYLVGKAEAYISEHTGSQNPVDSAADAFDKIKAARLRQKLSKAAGFPLITFTNTSDTARAFAARPDLTTVALQGPATPDHVIRTKRLPMIGSDVDNYVTEYKAYFENCAITAKEPKTMLDPAPRVVLDPSLGLISVGRTIKDARIIDDIYSHTMSIITGAEQLGGYKALPAQDIFDVEYWELEQAKLKKSSTTPMFSGEVALVTGGASGIGKACVDALLAKGAAVIALDINPAISTLYTRPDFCGIQCDLCNEEAVISALDKACALFGGIDMAVLNAGIFHTSIPAAKMDMDLWRKVFAINLDANLSLMQKLHPLLSLAPGGGRVSVIGSKNVPAPGPGASAYSASKAALTQLIRVLALEWGPDGIRINILHPNAVFDTGIWTSDVLAARAKSYGISVDEYKKRNILKTEITSLNVAELVIATLGPPFSKTTGAQIPIDGGDDRVI